MAERIILSHNGISKKKYEDRSFNSEDWQRIVKTMEAFSTDDIKIDDKISTIQGIKKELRSFKPDVLIVDYVQLLIPNSFKDSRERQVAELSRELKKITIDYGIIVLQLIQLAEKGTGNYRPHGESYTRESRAIYHD
ncbi:MAG: DnaB-like helicase C-terminal domain-containing protein [Terrisporobacter othiniensis]|uniref:DnaB-like helicase C-terminal domain-containing protein n=1 Tax=Terrisporobacter othiniensis TaxID=1577792 RepID=UPI002912F743|nr:DnaB-like helicase C-terminal domain-containing protein [Terrisporobacter othiniensis]MDU6984385.1 DnaB-like helicase C-terminal domain-containing protein [Terrisporobacter othiniensis]